MGRIEHTHNYISVIILIIDQNGIFAFKRKSQTPIPADIDRPVTGEFTFQLM